MIPNHHQLRPGQEALTPEQEAEAQRFAKARIEAQLSTEPVDEAQVEQLLRQAYVVAGLPPPERLQWADGPLPLVAALAASTGAARVEADVWKDAWENEWVSQWVGVDEGMGESVWEHVLDSVEVRVWEHVWARVGERVRGSVLDSVEHSLLQASVEASVSASVRAYEVASWLAYARFFDVYLAPNASQVLAHFNELVSGYWLGKEEAFLVRRPRLLVRDPEGRLHNTTGRAIEYRDGWGFYAWHGVRVSEQVILRPETLTREDFFKEENVEVRRIMQERMGERFVPELGGVVLDSGPRGTLYEVRLPADDPERVAHYVQVQDVSTERRYFLRVPPTIQTAAEAVAWSFDVAVQEYGPAHET